MILPLTASYNCKDDLMKHALKEWAVICKALAEGRQAITVRKGGIAEDGGEFAVEHTRFWLYPTYVHQQRAGIKPEAIPLLEQAEAERPPAGLLRLSHFAEVEGAYHVHNLVGALRLADLHLWSPETVQSRFAYRSPGLYVLLLRVFRTAQVHELPERDSYAECRSWVELEQDFPTDGATPVLSDGDFRSMLRTLDRLLEPTALA
jgi:hypothetical protein